MKVVFIGRSILIVAFFVAEEEGLESIYYFHVVRVILFGVSCIMRFVKACKVVLILGVNFK